MYSQDCERIPKVLRSSSELSLMLRERGIEIEKIMENYRFRPLTQNKKCKAIAQCPPNLLLTSSPIFQPLFQVFRRRPKPAICLVLPISGRKLEILSLASEQSRNFVQASLVQKTLGRSSDDSVQAEDVFGHPSVMASPPPP